MGTITSTCIELTVERRAGRSVLRRIAGGDLLRARPLPPDGPTARVALVQSAASLLAGDRVTVLVRLGAGAQLELIEVAATVSHGRRRGTSARLDVDIQVEEGARLVWGAQPLVLAHGSSTERTINMDLGPRAHALLRDTLVLGRYQEGPGSLIARTSVMHDGVPLHFEEVDTSDLALLRSPAVIGSATVIDTVARYGSRGETAGALQLHGPGTLLTQLGRETADTASSAAAAFETWRAEMLESDPTGDIAAEARDGLHLALPAA